VILCGSDSDCPDFMPNCCGGLGGAGTCRARACRGGPGPATGGGAGPGAPPPGR
jgi:hypothetical protein